MTYRTSAMLPYGPLEVHEVYLAHDGPKFFALRSARFRMFVLANCVDETDTGLEFLYLVLGEERFNAVRSGELTLMEAYRSTEYGDLWHVTEGDVERGDSATVIAFDDLNATWLPTEAARLELPTSTAPPLDLAELASISEGSLRHVIALELDPHGTNRTEFPARGLGDLLRNFQGAADAIAQEEYGTPTARSAIPAKILEGVQLSVLAMRAASFALVLGTDAQGALLARDDRLEAVAEKLQALFESTAARTELLEVLSSHHARSRARYKELLETLEHNQSGLGVVSVSRSGITRTTSISLQDVRGALIDIANAPKTEETIDVPRGTLLGSMVRTGRFELYDNASGRLYSGSVSDDAKQEIDGFAVGNSSFVAATLKVKIDFAAEDETAGHEYTLVSVRQLESSPDDA